MIKNLKPSPFITHVVFTTAASLATVAANLFVLRFLADGLGIEKFGAYSLASRLMAFLTPFASFLNLALPRFVSLETEERGKREILLGASLLGFLPILLLGIFGILLSDFLAKLVFHAPGYQTLFFNTLFWVAAFFLYSILEGYYFGAGKIRKANFWQIVLGVIGPFLITLAFSRHGSVEKIIFFLASLYLVTLIPLGFHFFQALAAKPAWSDVWARIQKLGAYALSRFPARFVLVSLFSTGPFFAPYFGSLKDAGFLAVGQMIFRFAELGSTAFGRVMLPKAGELCSAGRQEYLKERIEDIVAFIFQTGIFVTLQLALWVGPIILLWLGPQFETAVSLMQILTLSMTPYLLFIMLSSIIEMIEEKPINLIHLIQSLTVSLIVSLIGGKLAGTTGLAIGTSAGVTTLGALTLFYLWKSYRINFRCLEIKKVLLWNAVFFFAAFLVKNGLMTHWQGVGLAGAGLFAEGIFSCLYLFVLWKLQPRWGEELKKRLVKAPKNTPSSAFSKI